MFHVHCISLVGALSLTQPTRTSTPHISPMQKLRYDTLSGDRHVALRDQVEADSAARGVALAKRQGNKRTQACRHKKRGVTRLVKKSARTHPAAPQECVQDSARIQGEDGQCPEYRLDVRASSSEQVQASRYLGGARRGVPLQYAGEPAGTVLRHELLHSPPHAPCF